MKLFRIREAVDSAKVSAAASALRQMLPLQINAAESAAPLWGWQLHREESTLPAVFYFAQWEWKGMEET